MESCPTALLIDFSEPKVCTPRTPIRKTPKRACKRFREFKTTPEQSQLSAASQATNSSEEAEAVDATQPTEDARTGSLDAFMLDQETFDFDLSLSPGSSQKADESCEMRPAEDEEEIFFGPVGHKEKCIARSVEDDEPADVKPLSPLTASQMVLLFKEAQTVAFHVKACGTPQRPQSGSQSSVSELGCSPMFSDTPLVLGKKRKLSSLGEVPSEPNPKLKAHDSCKLDFTDDVSLETSLTVQIDDSHMELSETLEKTHDVKCEKKIPVSRNFKLPTSTTSSKLPLQRSASLRLPRSKLPSKGPLTIDKDVTVPKLPSRVRHVSAGQVQTPTNQKQPPSRLAMGKRKSDDVESEKHTNASVSIQRKLPRLGLKELIKPGTLQRKSTQQSCTKSQGGGLPKGPMKATAPIKSLQLEECKGPSTARRSLQMRGATKLTSPRKSTTSSTGSTPGRTPNNTRPKPLSALTPIKQDKCVQPKRILSSPSLATPRTSSTNSLSEHSDTPASVKNFTKRHSYLPTSGRNQSFSSVGSRSVRSSVSSNDSLLTSPVPVTQPERKKTNSNMATARRSLTSYSQNKENSRLVSPATRLASKLKPLRISDSHIK